MLNGEIRSKVDQVWNAFWAGGIANPLEVIEQITYLLFMRGLDDIQTREENKASMLGRPMERVIFPEGVYRTVRDQETGEVKEEITYAQLRWSQEEVVCSLSRPPKCGKPTRPLVGESGRDPADSISLSNVLMAPDMGSQLLAIDISEHQGQRRHEPVIKPPGHHESAFGFPVLRMQKHAHPHDAIHPLRQVISPQMT